MLCVEAVTLTHTHQDTLHLHAFKELGHSEKPGYAANQKMCLHAWSNLVIINLWIHAAALTLFWKHVFLNLVTEVAPYYVHMLTSEN